MTNNEMWALAIWIVSIAAATIDGRGTICQHCRMLIVWNEKSGQPEPSPEFTAGPSR